MKVSVSCDIIRRALNWLWGGGDDLRRIGLAFGIVLALLLLGRSICSAFRGNESVSFQNDLKLSANMYPLTIKIQQEKASGGQSAKLELAKSSSANRRPVV